MSVYAQATPAPQRIKHTARLQPDAKEAEQEIAIG